MAAAAARSLNEESDAAAVLTNSLIARMGPPDDIGRVVLFYASDSPSFITDSTRLADAGQMI
ncbi:hypothetical protein StoSoilB5_21040 [Arthrobacter sp. StoSoilB5]|nr:hypothetical protein StoSoilB5_21040 [Arthrobacter sp. StoSoilB5]